MLPRRTEDYRTLVWVWALIPLVLVAHYLRPDLGLVLLPVSCYLAIATGVIAHNHMHRPTMTGKWGNELFSAWISIFYGYPVFAWLPTHNLNHHRLVNRRGDATITWRYTNRHNLWVAATYPFVSSYFQSDWIKNYIVEARQNKPEVFRRIVTQYATTYGAHGAALALAIGIHGPGAGVRVWALSLGIPAFAALWTIMLFNYIQHVHTDPWSEHDHSRNFEGKLLNFLLFGNGYHTIHHEKASLHWADAARAHATLRPLIDDRLCHRSMWAFFFRQYVLSPFWRRLGTVQVGRAPFDDALNSVGIVGVGENGQEDSEQGIEKANRQARVPAIGT